MKLKQSDIITVDVDDTLITQAINIRRERDTLYGNYYSERDTDMRHVGEIGELVIAQLLSKVKNVDWTWHHDGEVNNQPDFTIAGRTFDVKTVKRQVPMKLEYTAQITAHQTKTPVNDYVFACYEVPKRRLHILGVIQKGRFLNQARYYGEGEQVHSNYTVRKGHAIYNLAIKHLYGFRQYVSYVNQCHNSMKKAG